MKILAIDDDPAILKVYQKLLGPPQVSEAENTLSQTAGDLFGIETQERETETNFELSTVSQGDTGLQMVEEAVQQGSPFALAFIDMRIPPGMNGLETAKSILAVDPHIEIVIVTAYSDQPRAEIAKVLGRARFLYLKKPFHPDELIQMAEMLTFRWQTQREREQLEAEKEVFASNMSHELNHPIHVILGVCNTLLTCEMDESQRNIFIQDIEKEGRQLEHLSRMLRTLSYFGEHSSALEMVGVNMVALAEHVVRLLTNDAQEKGLLLELHKDDRLPTVKGSEEQLIQVLLNLVVNAIHYTDSGSVKISLSQKEGQVEISVDDTGVGISESEQTMIFQKFYRVKKQALKVRGHGLGLSIVKAIVEAHHSQLHLTSQPDVGSRFSFSLKIKE